MGRVTGVPHDGRQKGRFFYDDLKNNARPDGRYDGCQNITPTVTAITTGRVSGALGLASHIPTSALYPWPAGCS